MHRMVMTKHIVESPVPHAFTIDLKGYHDSIELNFNVSMVWPLDDL